MASVGADYTVQSMADHNMIRLYKANIKWKRVIIKKVPYCSRQTDGKPQDYLCIRTKDIVFVPSDVHKFKAGQMVRIIDGSFKGVIGKVARYQGQQRVAVIIDGLLTIHSKCLYGSVKIN